MDTTAQLFTQMWENRVILHGQGKPHRACL